MNAFHGKPEIKAEYLARVAAYGAADELIKGQYWEIPDVLAQLEDRIFENLPNELAMTWPLRFVTAIEVGADLELVWPKFVLWLLMNPEHGVVRFNRHESILAVGALLQRWIDGNKPSAQEWRAAGDAASDAGDYDNSFVSLAAAYVFATYDKAVVSAAAADVNAAAAAAYEVYFESYSESYSEAYGPYGASAIFVNYAADAAAYYADYTDIGVGEKHFIIMSEKLLELLKESKCTG